MKKYFNKTSSYTNNKHKLNHSRFFTFCYDLLHIEFGRTVIQTTIVDINWPDSYYLRMIFKVILSRLRSTALESQWNEYLSINLKTHLVFVVIIIRSFTSRSFFPVAGFGACTTFTCFLFIYTCWVVLPNTCIASSFKLFRTFVLNIIPSFT